LVTLRDALHITKLLKAEHDTPEWQAAMEALLLVVEHDGPTMFARIGVMRALNRNVERTFNPLRKDHHWGKTEAEARSVMDIYDGADWTEMDSDRIRPLDRGSR